LNRERTYLAFASVLDVVAHGPHDHSVTEALFILVILLVTALAFDFTNGFHDTANAMATSSPPVR
jgi:hypothetical protein